MRKIWWLAIIPGVLAAGTAVFAVVLVIVLLVVKFLWAWTVPDLFPGAVQQGLVAREISWLASFKLALLAAVLSSLAGVRRR
jgi:hypothetical protein